MCVFKIFYIKKYGLVIWRVDLIKLYGQSFNGFPFRPNFIIFNGSSVSADITYWLRVILQKKKHPNLSKTAHFLHGGWPRLRFSCGYQWVNKTNHLRDQLLLFPLFLVFPEQQQNWHSFKINTRIIMSFPFAKGDWNACVCNCVLCWQHLKMASLVFSGLNMDILWPKVYWFFFFLCVISWLLNLDRKEMKSCVIHWSNVLQHQG